MSNDTDIYITYNSNRNLLVKKFLTKLLYKIENNNLTNNEKIIIDEIATILKINLPNDENEDTKNTNDISSKTLMKYVFTGWFVHNMKEQENKK